MVFFLLVAAYEALEKCHCKEGIEEHDKKDKKVSVVVSLPGVGGGGYWACAGQRAHCSAGNSPVDTIAVDTSVLQNLLASVE